MFDFIIAYFVFFLGYPIVLFAMAFDDSIMFAVWLIVAISLLWLLLKFKKYALAKVFVCFWIMPGTVVCGAAGIAPWFTTIKWAFTDGGCSNALSLSATFSFNLAIVFGFCKLYSSLKKRRQNA